MQPSIDASVMRQGMPLSAAPVALKQLLPQASTAEAAWTDFISENARDRQFIEMLRGFRETGGLARGDEVADMLLRATGHDVSLLARWIVTKQVLSFDWHGELWLPLFQFELATMERRENVRRVIAELSPAFDAWHLSCWFATPNSWLSGRAPVESLAIDLPAVLQAARADRFVAMG
jgi:hypothetical protein